MIICDQDTAKHVGDSLLKHARSIYSYANTYCRDDDANASLGEDVRAKFVSHVERLLKELYSLMLLARYKGVNRFCNTEQVEAYYEAAREIVAAKTGAADIASLLN